MMPFFGVFGKHCSLLQEWIVRMDTDLYRLGDALVVF
jgi:hypothetical protein